MDLKNFYNDAYKNWHSQFQANSSLTEFLNLQLPALKDYPPARSFLELGCGAGVHFPDQEDVWAVDFEPSALDKAGDDAQFEHVHFVCQDVCELELGRKFDLILDSHLLHCLVEKSKRQSYLANVFSHLNVSGHYYLETMISHKEMHFESEMEYFYFEPHLQKGDIPVRYIATAQEVEQELLDAGFSIVYLYVNAGKRMIPVSGREQALRSDPIVLRIIATKGPRAGVL